MANGSEQGEIVVSSIRTGMKREFAMMLKAQAECGIAIGQRRVTRSQLSSQNSPGNNSNSAKVSAKKRKKESKNGIVGEDLSNSKEFESNGVVKREESLVVLLSEEEEPKSDVVDLDCNSDDEKKSNKMDEEVAGKNEQNRGDDSKAKTVKMANADDNFVEAMPETVPVLAVTAQGDGKNEQKDDTKLEMAKTAKADECIVEVMPDIGTELAVTAQSDCKNEQNCGDNSKSEMGKTAKGNDGFVQAKSESVTELIVTALVDGKKEQNCGDEDKTEMLKTVKADDCIVEAKSEFVTELAVSAQGDGKDEKKVSFEMPTRRFTRSALKAKEETKVSRCDSIKIEEEVHETDSVGTMSAPAKLELKMSKKVALTKIPTKLKDLLDTGLLEGLPVRYIRGTKVRGRPETGLRGEIRGPGILCFCDNCHGTSVVTPNQFELHAGSANKRPPEYIYLENGKTLRDVLIMCKDAPSDELEAAIKNAIGSADAKFYVSACTPGEELKSTPSEISEASSRPTSSVPVTKLTDRMPSGSGTQSKVHGKLTRKDLRMHKLVFEEDALPDGTALAYYVRGQKLLEGYKKGHGIYCYCCNTEVSPSQFEAHAGCASRRKPYLYIYTSNGVSLHELSIKLSKERRSSAEENDDLCSICADGGDLLCCDNCPRAFHSECVSLPSIPTGTWYCKYCENMFAKERFVEFNANAIAAGRVAGIDAFEQITKRCIRMVEALDTEVSVCVLCRSQDFSKSGFDARTVIICDQCEKEYHVGCLKEHNIDDLQELPKDKWFCCTDCSRIHFALEKLVSEGEQKIPESLFKVLKEKNEGKDSENNSSLDIKWRLLSGKMSSEETRVWLSGAVSIFHDRFDPIADASTSRLDLIPHLVYGRNFKDQDYGGMFCAILLVNSVVVSAGIIRIFGKELAELPLVATSSNCQGQGYFQSLFSCIENLLQSLNVENLVLPSAAEAESIWINRFGFKKFTEEQLKNYRKNYQMMVFSGTSMLQKQVGCS
ncbi:PREDICTED: uncharacterized protein LOC109213128 [Nicotiana attenuata]|uniref:Increased dna methylation 1 n=1 Tax=Nicotiana attenuata TaxID=49451 RepID=A0A1J6KF51_NICAT|nr:PREDICTED: uncharacterized protein LOC109213128 [Nicotiana attenuata]OIT28046.1 increased dna methylation 1 [Nicotiana attenuata]